MLLVNLVLLFGGLALFVQQIVGDRSPALIGVAMGLETLAIILLCGHFTLQPNESRVLILFGDYHGTVRKSGFFWQTRSIPAAAAGFRSPVRMKRAITAKPRAPRCRIAP